VRKGPTLKVIR